MHSVDVISEAFGRVQGIVHHVVDGLSPDQLSTRPGTAPAGLGNSIAWLVWHLSRVQDDHVAATLGVEQVWITQGWAERFGLPFERDEIGYGQTPEEAARVRAPGELLVGYHDAVHDQTIRVLRGVADEELARVVDRSFDPPVTLGARLVSVISDDLQHGGQAAYAKGLILGS